MSNVNECDVNVDIKVGDDFALIFNEMASAGYLWSISVDDEEAFDVLESYFAPEGTNAESAIGGAASKMFNLKALKQGSFDVTFTHARPFDLSDKQDVVFKFNVRPS